MLPLAVEAGRVAGTGAGVGRAGEAAFVARIPVNGDANPSASMSTIANTSNNAITSTSSLGTYTSTSLTLTPLRRWPADFTVHEITEGIALMASLMSRDARERQGTAFERVFGCRYVKSTFGRAKLFWKRAGGDVRERYLGMGREDPRARWGNFVHVVDGRAGMDEGAEGTGTGKGTGGGVGKVEGEGAGAGMGVGVGVGRGGGDEGIVKNAGEEGDGALRAGAGAGRGGRGARGDEVGYDSGDDEGDDDEEAVNGALGFGNGGEGGGTHRVQRSRPTQHNASLSQGKSGYSHFTLYVVTLTIGLFSLSLL